MNNKTNKSLSVFMLFPSILDLKVRTNTALIERCSWFCSIKDYQSASVIADTIDTPIARLYKAIAENDYTNPEVFITEDIEDNHRARMIKCVATGFRLKGDLRVTEKLLAEASSLARKYNDVVTLFQTQKELSVVSSLDGDHKSAVGILRTIAPLTKYLYRYRPAYYFDFLNSVAVELSEVGKVSEAMRYCNAALASPFASRYDGWLETEAEIVAKKQQYALRSVIAVPELPVEKKVLDLVSYKVDRLPDRTINTGPADVLDFEHRTAKMAKGQAEKKQQTQTSRKETLEEIFKLLRDANQNDLERVKQFLLKSQHKDSDKI